MRNLNLVLMGGAMLSKSLIQLSVDRWGYVHFLLFSLSPDYCRDKGSDSVLFNLLQKDLCQHCCVQSP